MKREAVVTKHLKAVVLTLAVSTALVGCAGKIKYPSYYTLNLPAPPDPPAAKGVRLAGNPRIPIPLLSAARTYCLQGVS